MIRLASGELVEVTPKNGEYSIRLSISTQEGERICRLPCEEGLSYWLWFERETNIVLENAVVRSRQSGLTARLFWACLCFMQRFSRLKPFALGLSVFALGGAVGRKNTLKLAKDLKILRLLGLHLGFKDDARGRFICDGVSGNDHENGLSLMSPKAKLCILIHLYFTDVWPDFLTQLRAIDRRFRLIVTIPHHEKAFGEALKRQMPDAQIELMDNFGRDIGPLFVLNEKNAFEGCELILKIHGKKSYRDQKPTLLGDLWRRQTLWDLLSPAQLQAALDQFEANPRLGILGPENLRLPNQRLTTHDAWGSNQLLTLKWAQKINDAVGSALDYELDYFSGTMFFIRPVVLKSFLGLGLEKSATYGLEQGAIDANLEHALERLFCHAARLQNHEIATLGPTS